MTFGRPPAHEPVDVPIALTVSALAPAASLYGLTIQGQLGIALVLFLCLSASPLSVLLCRNLLRTDVAGWTRKALGVALLVNLALGGTTLALLVWGAIRPR